MAQAIARTSRLLTVTAVQDSFTLPVEGVSYIIWSADVQLIIEEDNEIDAHSFRVPQNVLWGPARILRTLYYRSVAGNGIAFLKWLPRGAVGTTDWQEFDRRGGVQIGIDG